MNDLQRVWSNLNPGWRHLEEDSNNVKRNIEYIKESLSYLPDKVDRMVDWGPGGGFLSKFISENKQCNEIDIVDITDDCFQIINDNLNRSFKKVNLHLFESDLNTLDIKPYPDLLIAYSVIYHFPSLNYAKQVLHYFNNVLKPKTLLIRNFFTFLETNNGEKIHIMWEADRNDYFVKGNVLRGNLMSLDSFLSLLSNYTVLSDTNNYSIYKRGYPMHYSSCLVMELK